MCLVSSITDDMLQQNVAGDKSGKAPQTADAFRQATTPGASAGGDNKVRHQPFIHLI